MAGTEEKTQTEWQALQEDPLIHHISAIALFVFDPFGVGKA